MKQSPVHCEAKHQFETLIFPNLQSIIAGQQKQSPVRFLKESHTLFHTISVAVSFLNHLKPITTSTVACYECATLGRFTHGRHPVLQEVGKVNAHPLYNSNCGLFSQLVSSFLLM